MSKFSDIICPSSTTTIAYQDGYDISSYGTASANFDIVKVKYEGAYKYITINGETRKYLR